MANRLTVFRAIIGLPVILLLANEKLYLAWIFILIGGLSDYADGALSRKAGGGSIFGSRLDPLADKLLLIAPLLWISAKGIVPLWSIWILISRELIVSNWRSSQESGGPASFGGKFKTLLQFLSILLLIWPHGWVSNKIGEYITNIGLLFFWLSLLLS